jgi:hypothetical protein
MKTPLHPVVVALALLNAFQANALVTITQHPTDQVVSLNAHLTNSVTATTTAPPITYQWYGKGAILPDQTNRTLVLNNIQLDQAGEYYVVVQDADNQPVQSNPATVTVNPTFVKITEGAIVTDSEPSGSSTWWDYDNDGDMDVVVHLADLPSGSGLAQSFYRNDGNGVFTKTVTNLVAQTLKRGTIGAVGDYDNDGDLDLYLGSNAWQANNPKDDLFRNEGNGRFTVVANGPWRSILDHTWDPSFVDLNGDGLLDIFVVNYDQPPCLYRQTSAGTFVNLAGAEVGSILTNPGHSYNAAWVDYDGDGDLDLWFEEYRGRASLHRNEGNGSFTLATPPSFAQSPGGMGVWADFDNDGYPELFVGGDTETGVRPLALYRGTAGQDFQNVATTTGVALSIAAWASAIGDYDNDGWLDIFAAYWYEGAANPAKTNVLFHNRGDGTFEPVDVGSPIRDGHEERTGATWVDYDNDGFLDLFMSCGNGGISRVNHLYRSNRAATGNPNHWLKVKLTGEAANRSGIGARIRVKATINGQEVWQLRELTGNGFSQTCPGLVAHFGLGDATQADVVRVEWPSGNLQELTNVPADQLRSISEQVLITPVRPSSSLGGSVTLTAQLNGTWQWYHDGVAFDGQTAKTLTLSNIQATDAARYSVVVTTATGTFTNHVYLLVDTQFERIEMGDTTPSWGCAWGDYNNDGYPDLFVGEGTFTSMAACSLYRNNQDGTLSKVTPEEAGDIVGRLGYWQSPAWGDIDNDGDLDLIVSHNPPTGEPRPALWRNLGNERFEDATSAGSFLSDRLWCNPTWGDFNHDGFLDLAVANAWDEPPSWPDWSRNLLYLNRRDGSFERVATGDLVAFRAGLMVEGGAAGDMDGNGDLDILIGSHSGTFWFRNDGSGIFNRVTTGFPSVTGTTVAPSWADYDNDNDGRLDVFVPVHHGAATSQLLHNDGNAGWSKIPLGPSLETGGASWADYDNDGDLDLFITRGQTTTTTNLLYANNGDGAFTQVTLGSMANDWGRWADSAWADYDNNGFQDLFVTAHGGTREVLYCNHGNGNHWISFTLVGTRSNRSAIGAKVRVRATIFGKTHWQTREVSGGNRHQNDLRPHFGLGDAPRATTVRIEWPSGAVEEFSNLARDQFHPIVEPSLRGAMKPDGEFELSVWASTNRTCTIESSTDVVTWSVLTTVNGQGETPVTYTEAPGQNQRFYRMK